MERHNTHFAAVVGGFGTEGPLAGAQKHKLFPRVLMATVALSIGAGVHGAVLPPGYASLSLL